MFALMTSDGSPYARFRRALATGNPNLVIPAAAELGRLSLDDALAVVLVLRAGDAARFERAIVRWHSLAAHAARGLGAPEAQLMLAALQALRGPAAVPAGRLLAELCALYELAAAAEVLDAWLERSAAAG